MGEDMKCTSYVKRSTGTRTYTESYFPVCIGMSMRDMSITAGISRMQNRELDLLERELQVVVSF